MTSPDLIRELQESRPEASASLRARVRELTASEAAPARPRLRISWPRPALVVVPLAAAFVLGLGAAGVVGLAGSGGNGQTEAATAGASTRDESRALALPTPEATKGAANSPSRSSVLGPAVVTTPDATVGPTQGRAQRVAATLTLRVADSDRVSKAAQQALDITRSLGGHVLQASVATGGEGQATLTVRIPVARTEEAIRQLSALGTIVSQQVSIQDLQEQLDALTRRTRSVRAQIVRITARLESEQLDAETRAVLELRRRTLRNELRGLRSSAASTTSEARFSTVELSVVTPKSEGVVPVPSRLDRGLDKAVEVLAWEAIVALVVLLVAAPLVILAVAAWFLRRLYRRHEEDRLLAAS